MCFSKVGFWLFFIPPLLCAKACNSLCLSPAKRSLIFHMEELSGSSSSADYYEQYPFSASCNLSTGVWARKGSSKAQFVFNIGETVSCLVGCCREVSDLVQKSEICCVDVLTLSNSASLSQGNGQSTSTLNHFLFQSFILMKGAALGGNSGFIPCWTTLKGELWTLWSPV